ncbi:MAG TPA: acetate kinase [Bryobacteraceae bacterium]|nr:acetate kinase [Bryobacteraceae bacterium]
MKILVLNGGSSGLKAMLWDTATLPDRPVPTIWEARVDWGRHAGCAELRIRTERGEETETLPITSPDQVLQPVLQAALAVSPVDVAGHRVVHGGKAFRETTRITPQVRAEIARLVEFAPEHNRLELEAIDTAERMLPSGTPQVAVFDTAFHSSLPEEAVVYPGPYNWLTDGVRRYGFHGISHQYVSRRAAQILGRDDLRLVTCHLGNGASLAAVKAGKSIDTTMGFTPLEGLMMGTRSGSIDPGIIIYLVRHCGYRADDLDRILNKESGLKGVSGLSADMRDIEAAMHAGNTRAKLAFDLYIHRLCREIGGMVASLGGVDALVFTAGIGENSTLVRQRACTQFAFLGVELDGEKNAASPADVDIATTESTVRVLVVRTEEDWEIARECHRIVKEHGNA